MKRSFAIAVVFVVLASSSLTLEHGIAQSEAISPLTGEIGYSIHSEDGPRESLVTAPAKEARYLVAGGLYGTDGQNLYIIDKTTGSATLIGSHGPVETAIGALAFGSNGILYGTSVTGNAKLYTINPTNGVATAIGPLGIGDVFEGGLDFDASGQLLGVNQGDSDDAKAFTINTATGAATVLGPTPGANRDINGLASDGQTFYAIDRVSNSLGTLNPTTGSYSPIGNPGVTIGDAGGLAIDPVDGTLYAAFGGTGGLYVLDKSTGTATLIANNNVAYGLAFAPQQFTAYLPGVFKGYAECVTTPTLISPSNNSSLSTIAPLFKWDNGNNPSATRLRIQTATDAAFTHLVKTLLGSGTGGIRQHRFSSNFGPSTIYYWRAYLMCGDTQGPYSEVWSFTSGSGGAILPSPTLIAPANGSTVPATTVTLQWSSVSGAVEYLVHWRQVGEEGYTFTWVSDTKYTVSGLSANITYEWWVSARNDYAIGTDSVIWRFTTPAGSFLSFQGLNNSIMVENDETNITSEERDSK